MFKNYKTRVFISGRVSGIGYKYAKRRFKEAQRLLEETGYIVVNPTKLCRQNWGYWHCMVVCLFHLLFCRYVYVLSNWKNSRGAKIEVKIAKKLNKILFIEK